MLPKVGKLKLSPGKNVEGALMGEFRKLVFKRHRIGKVDSLTLFTVQENEVFNYTTRIFYNSYVLDWRYSLRTTQ